MKRKQKLWSQSHYKHCIKKKKRNNKVRVEHGPPMAYKSTLPTELSEAAWKYALEQGLSTYGEELAK
jgi:hypothetical protein